MSYYCSFMSLKENYSQQNANIKRFPNACVVGSMRVHKICNECLYKLRNYSTRNKINCNTERQHFYHSNRLFKDNNIITIYIYASYASEARFNQQH